ncbi:hypothetical protein [Methylocapsa acidiphila]|uniref:hypothetical protein n=1 Tax=Methylocapsa acidiphila TaxID=133552 RepID=UPI0003F56E43|nr:hypothetical protein [Methylocapsa acidiphila]
MTFDARPRAQIAAVHADTPAEHLFFAQFRYWMAGYSLRDISCWDSAWDSLLRFVAEDAAKTLYSEFHLFTRALKSQSERPIRWRPDVCRCLLRDEYLALCLVSASQRNERAREFSAAAELLATDQVHVLLMASRSLAQALLVRRFLLAPGNHASEWGTEPRASHTRQLH